MGFEMLPSQGIVPPPVGIVVGGVVSTGYAVVVFLNGGSASARHARRFYGPGGFGQRTGRGRAVCLTCRFGFAIMVPR